MAKKKLYRYPLYLLARLMAGVVFLVPRSWALSFARRIGALSYQFITRQREKALRNLRQAYGDVLPEFRIREMARRVFENSAETAVEILQMSKWNAENAAERIDAGEIGRVYDELLHEGKGIISLTAHIGSWELLAGLMSLKGYRGVILARRIYFEPYNRWIVGLRSALGVPTVYRDESAKKIFQILKQNQIVGLLPDQDVESLKGVFVPFFDKPAYTTIAPAKIALATGAPMVTNFLIRQPGGRYRVVVGDVIRPVVETTREEAVHKLTGEWMASMEKVIREYPEQWAWMHDRWKTQPERNAEAEMVRQNHSGKENPVSFPDIRMERFA